MNEELEKAIDVVGRDRVFGRAKSYGWQSDDGPPEWVWWGIVHELRSDTPPLYREQKSVFSFLWGSQL